MKHVVEMYDPENDLLRKTLNLSFLIVNCSFTDQLEFEVVETFVSFSYLQNSATRLVFFTYMLIYH